jgi:hypothetical protein
MLDGTFFFGVGVPAPSTATLPAAGSTGLALVLLALGTLLAAISTHARCRGRAPA